MILQQPLWQNSPSVDFWSLKKPQWSLCHLNVWNPTPLCTLSSSGTSLVCLKGWTETNKISPFSDSSETTQIHSHIVAGNEGLHPKNLRVKSFFFWTCTPTNHNVGIAWNHTHLKFWFLNTLCVVPYFRPNETPGLKGTQWSNALQSGTTATHRLLFDGTPCRCVNVPQGGVPIALLGDGREHVSLKPGSVIISVKSVAMESGSRFGRNFTQFCLIFLIQKWCFIPRYL